VWNDAAIVTFYQVIDVSKDLPEETQAIEILKGITSISQNSGQARGS